MVRDGLHDYPTDARHACWHGRSPPKQQNRVVVRIPRDVYSLSPAGCRRIRGRRWGENHSKALGDRDRCVKGSEALSEKKSG